MDVTIICTPAEMWAATEIMEFVDRLEVRGANRPPAPADRRSQPQERAAR